MIVIEDDTPCAMIRRYKKVNGDRNFCCNFFNQFVGYHLALWTVLYCIVLRTEYCHTFTNSSILVPESKNHPRTWKSVSSAYFF